VVGDITLGVYTLSTSPGEVTLYVDEYNYSDPMLLWILHVMEIFPF
jgi:hypothetical protein